MLQKLSKENYYTPVLLVISLVLLTSSISGSSYFTYRNTIHLFTGFCEILIVLTTLPNYFVLIIHSWCQKSIIPDRLVVFLAPLNMFLFIFGSTYITWITAVYGIGTCAWLIQYRLPLNVSWDKLQEWPYVNVTFKFWNKYTNYLFHLIFFYSFFVCF